MLKQVVFFHALIWICKTEKLPSSLKKCDAHQSNFNSCLKEAVENAFGLLKNPIPELDLPSFDPLYLTKEVIPNNHAKLVSADELFNKLAFSGLTETKVLKFDLNFKKKTLETILLIDHFQINYINFTINGDIYGEEFHFTAHGFGKYKGTKFSINATFEELQRKNNRFINITDTKVLWTMDELLFSAEGENKEIERYNQVVHEHLEPIFKAVENDFENFFGHIFSRFANSAFSRVPIAELFNLELI